ncbi:hypothetical protein AVEN_91016-1 [Araneus ventricosus]|uniref:Uncharacterized protein n=1 Tax=Araneus ventricosus TaxID=182803 RepID=A0A4Y2S4M7_ARAVE|nr:hypothetical protein AVEN_91016-1 [Araneus ventricosus]
MTNLWQTCTLVVTNLWQACCKLKLLSGRLSIKECYYSEHKFYIDSFHKQVSILICKLIGKLYGKTNRQISVVFFYMAEARRNPSGIYHRCGATNEPGLRRVPSGCPGQPSSPVLC